MADITASVVLWTEPPFELIDHKWYGPRGAFIDSDPPNGGTHWTLCCPRCGQVGAPRQGQTWRVVGGSWDDVESLSLMPSILKSCCGWHGWLVCGVFTEKCPGT